MFTVTNAGGCSSPASSVVVVPEASEAPSAPTVGTIIQPSCSMPTGSVVIGGLPSAGTWTLTQTPDNETITGNGNNTNITGLKPGTYSFKVTNSSGCTSGLSDIVTINANKPGVIPRITIKYEDLLICYNLGDSIVSFQWFNGSNPIPNATLQYYQTMRQPGTYSVVTVDINGCINTSNSIKITGIKSISVYPNPASESFALKMTNYAEGEAIIRIFNSTGLKVMEFEVNDFNDEMLKKISVDGLREGIYYIQVLLVNREVYYSKIVVAR